MPEKKYSTQYKCPHCTKVIDKPERYVTLAGSRGITIGASPYDYCQYCHGQIERQAIINGQYDYSTELGWVGSLMLLAFWAGVVGVICIIAS